jgi:hypothetical protein
MNQGGGDDGCSKISNENAGFFDVRLALVILLFPLACVWILWRWLTRKSPAPFERKAPGISAPHPGMFVCSPQEHPRLLLRESAKYFRRAFELLRLAWLCLRYDWKLYAKSPILFVVSHAAVFRRKKGSNSCQPANVKNEVLSNAKKVDAPGAFSDALNPCQNPQKSASSNGGNTNGTPSSGRGQKSGRHITSDRGFTPR